MPARLDHARMYAPAQRAIRSYKLRIAIVRTSLRVRGRSPSLGGRAPEPRWPYPKRENMPYLPQSLLRCGDGAPGRLRLRENGIDRQRDLDLLDSEINAFINLIAARCGG